LGALQVDKNADRIAEGFFDCAYLGDCFAQYVMTRMAHIDAEHICPSAGEFLDYALIGRGGAQGGENLDAAVSSHCGSRLMLVSVNCTVQSVLSPVSSSKKPVRS